MHTHRKLPSEAATKVTAFAMPQCELVWKLASQKSLPARWGEMDTADYITYQVTHSN